MSLFCRHNRFVAECPICSKGTVLDPERRSGRRPRPAPSGGARPASRRPAAAAATQSRGPYASAGPYDGREVRLERVPGGLRLASWRGGSLDRSAPLLDAPDLPGLVAGALEQGLLPAAAAIAPLASDAALERPPRGAAGPAAAEADATPAGAGLGAAEADATPAAARPTGAEAESAAARAEPAYGRSPGRAGELRDELRVERLEGGQVRVARWVMRPNRGWELQDAPVMLAPGRFAEALADAATRGVLAPGRPGA